MVRLLVFAVLLSIIACTTPGCVNCDDPVRETMVTRPATEVTATSARLNGSTPNYHDGIWGNDRCLACFEWYSEADETRLFTPDIDTWRFEDCSENITGLTPGMTYYFRHRWIQSFPVKTYPPGEWMSFTCPTYGDTTVETLDATEISGSSATLNGNLPGLRGALSVDVFFQWGTESGSYPNETPRQTVTSLGTFSAEISGLSLGMTYYFVARAWFSNTGGTALGLERSLYTGDLPEVVVETAAASGFSSSSATLNGNLTDLAGHSSVQVYFMWGTSPGSFTVE